jgi:hypothetical protein
VKGKTIVEILEWPSWLNKGHKRHIAIFNEMFYSDCYIEKPCTKCMLCGMEFEKSFWYHMLYDCKKLRTVDTDPMWHAFCSLLDKGQRGLAMFTCFPLLCR